MSMFVSNSRLRTISLWWKPSSMSYKVYLLDDSSERAKNVFLTQGISHIWLSLKNTEILKSSWFQNEWNWEYITECFPDQASFVVVGIWQKSLEFWHQLTPGQLRPMNFSQWTTISVLKRNSGDGFKWYSGVRMWQETKSDWKNANQEIVDGFRMVWLVSCVWKGNHPNGIQIVFRMCDVLQASPDRNFSRSVERI
jgi:hypothetical protein